MTTPHTALLEALPSPYDWCYEWDGPYGTRKFSAAQYNGRKPTRSVALFSEEQMRAYGEACARAALAQAEAAPNQEAAGEMADQEMIDCWRANYGLHRNPHDLHEFWKAGAPAGAVLALRAAVIELERIRAAQPVALPTIPPGETDAEFVAQIEAEHCRPPRMHPSECQHGTARRYACRACEDALATGEGIEGLRLNAQAQARAEAAGRSESPAEQG